LCRAMTSVGLPFPANCGPAPPDHNRLPFASLLDNRLPFAPLLAGDPALALEQLNAPLGSEFANLLTWTENFFKTGMPDVAFAQFYEVYVKLNPNRARVPPEYLEEFKEKRAGDCPEIRQVEEARACAPEACDVVPPPPPDPPAPSPPPPPLPQAPTEAQLSIDGTHRTPPHAAHALDCRPHAAC